MVLYSRCVTRQTETCMICGVERVTINPDYFFLSKRSHPNHKVTSLCDYSVKETYKALLPMTARFTPAWFASTYVYVNALCCLVLRAHYSTRF